MTSALHGLCPVLNQLAVGQRLTVKQHEQGVAEQELVLPMVEPELHLVKVGGQVLGADLVVAADARRRRGGSGV